MKPLVALFAFCMLVPLASASLFDADGIANEQPSQESYDEIVDALFGGDAVGMMGDKLWVPWFSSSTSCSLQDLQRENNCNVGTIDFTHNCMVSDELSQVGILIAMGKDQKRMDAFMNTLQSINTSHGMLPSWRIYRSGNRIEPCKEGINGNCDTASDATARFIIALSIAGDNHAFNTDERQRYRDMATRMSQDFLTYEVAQECHPGRQGEICYWLASGSSAMRGGLSSTDFGYTGYYGDAIVAMLHMCRENETYCRVAGNLTLNYLQAAGWDGETFSVPPGRSFRWENVASNPTAVCTNTCNPVMWDASDAPRSMIMCHALYYSEQLGMELPGLAAYCAQWSKDMRNPDRAPTQYFANGTIFKTQSGTFSQGLQSLFQSGAQPHLYQATLTSAIDHYSEKTRTFDWSSCFGVYKNTLAVRSLGIGLERDYWGVAPEAPSGTSRTQARVVPAGLAISVDHLSFLRYLFTCDARGMEPISYSWRLGDERVLTNEESIEHEFPSSGAYKVGCIARNGSVTWSTLMSVFI